jgi:hypothetical protein
VAALPIFFGQLEASLNAVMLFPRRLEQAKVCVAWLIMQDVGNMRRLGLEDHIDPPPNELLEVACAASDFAYIYDDAQKNMAEGQRAGMVVASLWGVIGKSPETASWESAIQTTERYFARRNRKLAASRTRFHSCLSEFKPVLHLLGARTVRRDPARKTADTIDLAPTWVPGTDKADRHRRLVDVIKFVGEARDLQNKLSAWEEPRGGAMLGELFDLSASYLPGFGRIKDVVHAPEFEITKSKGGRPRKPLS